jgi:hypothetical protein
MHTHAGHLERWLGASQAEGISRAMREFYWPIAVHGVPGSVFAMPGGDFRGEIRAGSEVSAVERAADIVRREKRRRFARAIHARHQLGAFANLSALIAAASGGKAQQITFQKVGTAATAVANAMSLWAVGAQPIAGASGAAAPGGTANTNASTGALKYANPVNANTGHFITGYVSGGVVANTLLLYDRLFSVAKTMSSLTAEAVTGTFARYQNQTATAADYIGGNFCFPETLAALGATGHNWTVCQYTDDAGNTLNSFPSIAGITSGVINQIDLAAGNWFMPLASGDVGVKALTQMQCSASVTGTLDFVVGHPIAFFPCPVANMVCVVDGINTAFNMTNVYDNACLAFIEMPKPATTATTYSGLVTLVAE